MSETRERMIDGVAKVLFATILEEGYSGARIKAATLLEGEFKKMDRLSAPKWEPDERSKRMRQMVDALPLAKASTERGE